MEEEIDNLQRSVDSLRRSFGHGEVKISSSVL